MQETGNGGIDIMELDTTGVLTILDVMPDAVTVVDAEGRVAYWNRAAERVYGIAREDILGRPVSEFFPRESVMLLQVLQTGMPVTHVYHRPRPGWHVFISAVPLRDASGRLVGAAAVERDITAVIRLSERHAALNAEAGQASLWLHTPWMSEVVELLRFGPAHGPLVLVMGEPGTGKASLLRQALQELGAPGPVWTVACESLSEPLSELELFGAAGGSQAPERPGALARAAGGVLLLRRIDALPITTLHRLGHAITEGWFQPPGGDASQPLRCRIVATADANLPERVAAGEFPARLYYAFQHVVVPPLRARRDEISTWAVHFLREVCRELGRPLPSLTGDAVAALTAYDWPGNLPELRHAMRAAVQRATGPEVTAADLPIPLRPVTLQDVAKEALPLPRWSSELERDRIEQALRQCGGNKARAARMLGISRGSLYYKLRQYGMEE